MTIEYSNVYWKIYDAAAAVPHPRFIHNEGGARSTKTYSSLQFLNDLIPAADKAGDITSVVSETLPHLKKGAIRDFERIIGTPLKQDPHWNASENIYTYDNGAKLEFFSVDAPQRVQGPARKRLFMNEANHIKWETARQLFIRTTGLILLDNNPEAAFWAHDKIDTRDTCTRIHSTYKDNPFLSEAQVQEIEANKSDANWWRVYGEGLVGVLEGLIFPDFEQIDSLPTDGNLIDVYGLDFGFTHDPSVLQHCLIDTARRIIYVDEVFYQRGMLNSDMADAMRAEGVSNRAEIYADAAEPKTIAELGSYGFNIRACYKATRKAEQLQALKGYALKVTKRSVNTIRELRGYTWAKDKDGNFMNEPIAINDHAMDAMRYGCFSYMEQYGLSQRLTFGFGSF